MKKQNTKAERRIRNMKTIMSLVVLGILLVGTFAFAVSAAPVNGNSASSVEGDVNGDGFFNIADPIALNAYLGKKDSVKVNQKNSNYDYNLDGMISFWDSNEMLNDLFVTGNRVEGDANGDGDFNVADVTFLSQYLAGARTMLYVDNADMTRDGRLDQTDVDLMLDALFEDSDNEMKGDVNENGLVNIEDVVMLSNYLSKKKNVQPMNMNNADFDDNGKVEWKDLVGLVNELFMNQDSLLLGDANDDGSVNIADAVAITHYSNGKRIMVDLQNADFNQDGEVDKGDMKDLLDYLFPSNDSGDSEEDENSSTNTISEEKKEDGKKDKQIYSRPPTRSSKI
jgi:hypothetical protein